MLLIVWDSYIDFGLTGVGRTEIWYREQEGVRMGTLEPPRLMKPTLLQWELCWYTLAKGFYVFRKYFIFDKSETSEIRAFVGNEKGIHHWCTIRLMQFLCDLFFGCTKTTAGGVQRWQGGTQCLCNCWVEKTGSRELTDLETVVNRNASIPSLCQGSFFNDKPAKKGTQGIDLGIGHKADSFLATKWFHRVDCQINAIFSGMCIFSMFLVSIYTLEPSVARSAVSCRLMRRQQQKRTRTGLDCWLSSLPLISSYFFFD